jgi:hypothetical protein
MFNRVKRLAPAVSLSLSVIFSAAAAGAQDIPAKTPAPATQITPASANPLQTYKANENSPPLYASPETLEKLGPFLRDHFTQWAGQPVMALSKDDIFKSLDDLPPPFVMIQTPHGTVPAAQMARMEAAYGNMTQIISENSVFFGSLSGSKISSDLAGNLTQALSRQSPANIHMAYFTDKPLPGCVVTLGKLDNTPIQVASDFLGGAPKEVIKNIPGDALSWNVFTYLHELAGHCAMTHVAQNLDGTLEGETEADAIAVQKYFELIGEGAPLDPAVPGTIMDLRAFESLFISPNRESALYSPGADFNDHATQVGASFYNAAVLEGKGKLTGEKILNAVTAANTKIHDLVFLAFAEEAANRNDSDKNIFVLYNPGPDHPGVKVSKSFSREDLMKNTSNRTRIGGGIARENPDLYYAAVKAMLDLDLVDKNTLAWRHMYDFDVMVREHLPSLVNDELVTQAKKYIMDNKLSNYLHLDYFYEKEIFPHCPPIESLTVIEDPISHEPLFLGQKPPRVCVP